MNTHGKIIISTHPSDSSIELGLYCVVYVGGSVTVPTSQMQDLTPIISLNSLGSRRLLA